LIGWYYAVELFVVFPLFLGVFEMEIREMLEELASGGIGVSEARRQVEEESGCVLEYRVSAKGGLSVYGLGRHFPVTLYASEWERIDGAGERERRAAFIRAHVGELKRKASVTSA